MTTMTEAPARHVDDLLDRLVAEYSDELAQGRAVDRAAYLARAPAEHRPALDRCLAMIDSGRASARPSRRDLLPGDELGGFRIVGLLGKGGMAHVYRAEQPELSRSVALKVLRPGLALDQRHVDRFRREALSVARLEHPNIVSVYAVGEQDGFHYIAMECVEGPNLRDVLDGLPRDRAPTPEDLAAATNNPTLAHCESYEEAVATLLAPVCRAVGVAHDLGIVHRDIKPGNILVHRDGRVLIADFGLAKGDGDLELSLTGEPLGTPYYMSPEQVQQSEARVDARTDVYSLGVTLYEAFARRRPFQSGSLAELFDEIRRGTPVPLRQAARGSSRQAEAVVMRAMARDPDARYRSALELGSDLTALAEGAPTQAAALRGSGLKHGLRVLGRALLPGEFEYRSATTFLGWPLIHINKGAGARRLPGSVGARGPRVAKGWIAVGQVAIGGLAVGGLATGGLAVGGFSAGLVGLGGMVMGLLALGGMAFGGMGIGGLAVGWHAIGGVAWGRWAAGGTAFGASVMSGARIDQEAVEHFEVWMPWIVDFFRHAGAPI